MSLAEIALRNEFSLTTTGVSEPPRSPAGQTMNIIHARQPLDVTTPSIFLAGPTPRSSEVQSWRPEAFEILEQLNFPGTICSPEEPEVGGLLPTYGEDQVQWEWAALDLVDVIVFWVPRDLTTLPGFTTNVEFGLYCASGRAMLGYPKGAPKMGYLHQLADRFSVPVFHDLSTLLQSAVDQISHDALERNRS